MTDQPKYAPGGYVPGTQASDRVPFVYRHDLPDGRKDHLINAEGIRTGKCSVCGEQVFKPIKVRAGRLIPEPPAPIPDEPKAMIRRTDSRERGWHAWEAWVGGTLIRQPRVYAWTEERARRKALDLLARYRRENSRGPEIEVQEDHR